MSLYQFVVVVVWTKVMSSQLTVSGPESIDQRQRSAKSEPMYCGTKSSYIQRERDSTIAQEDILCYSTSLRSGLVWYLILRKGCEHAPNETCSRWSSKSLNFSCRFSSRTSAAARFGRSDDSSWNMEPGAKGFVAF